MHTVEQEATWEVGSLLIQQEQAARLSSVVAVRLPDRYRILTKCEAFPLGTPQKFEVRLANSVLRC